MLSREEEDRMKQSLRALKDNYLRLRNKTPKDRMSRKVLNDYADALELLITKTIDGSGMKYPKVADPKTGALKNQ